MEPRRHTPAVQVGDEVELRGSAVDVVGTVIALLRGDDHVRVEWLRGEGYAGKTTMLSSRAVRKRIGG
jgi:hypothetical protein